MKDVHKQLQIPEENINKKSNTFTSYGNLRRLRGRDAIQFEVYRETNESLINRWKK